MGAVAVGEEGKAMEAAVGGATAVAVAVVDEGWAAAAADWEAMERARARGLAAERRDQRPSDSVGVLVREKSVRVH